MEDVRTRRIYNGTFFHFLFYAQVRARDWGQG